MWLWAQPNLSLVCGTVTQAGDSLRVGKSLCRSETKAQDARSGICGLRSWIAQTFSCIFVKKTFEGVGSDTTSTVEDPSDAQGVLGYS